MSWWGKIVGGAFGYLLGGPLGGVLGAALGHRFDEGLNSIPDEAVGWGTGAQERVQTAFFTATFSVMGHVAKADGQVTRDEIRMAEAVMAEMDLDTAQRRAAVNLFSEGKRKAFPLDDILEQLRRECHGRTTLIRMFIEILLQAAYADGRYDDVEDRAIRHICQVLGFSEFEYVGLRRMIEAELHFRSGWRRGERADRGEPSPAGPSTRDAYAVLGVAADASDADVKKAYRRLLSQHHPDKLVAKGLPEEMMKIATQKTHEIKQAYEHVKLARGM